MIYSDDYAISCKKINKAHWMIIVLLNHKVSFHNIFQNLLVLRIYQAEGDHVQLDLVNKVFWELAKSKY